MYLSVIENAGFSCIDEYDYTADDCDVCNAKEYCDKYEEIMEARDDFLKCLRDMQEETP